MRLTARSLVPLIVMLLCWKPAVGQCHCECINPPGGKTDCPEHNIAVCSVGTDGVCHGSCTKVNVILLTPPEDLTASLFSNVFGDQLSAVDVKGQPRKYASYLGYAIKSYQAGTPWILAYNNRTYKVSFGMDQTSVALLQSTQKQLESTTPIRKQPQSAPPIQ
jgi:hypothetical protein